MTRRKQLWGQQRGWIVPSDGSPPQELPQQMVGYKLISWLGTMPQNAAREARAERCLEGLLSSLRAEPGGCVGLRTRGPGRGIPVRAHQDRNPAPAEGTVVGVWRRSSACWTRIAAITRSITARAVSRVRGIASRSV